MIAVEPAQVNVPLGNQFEVEITVTDGVNVNAFDVRITYNQQRLSLASWSHGDYLSAISCVNEIKSPGLLELGCTQLGQTAVSGDGVLLKLVFDTLALGTADITLAEAVFADGGGSQVQPERVNGLVSIQSLPTWTSTATNTMTPTITRTATITQTPTTTPTRLTPSPIPAESTVTHSPSLVPSATLRPNQSTPTPEGTATKTLTTPISGVQGPSRRSPTPIGTAQSGTVTVTHTLEGDQPDSTSATQISHATAVNDEDGYPIPGNADESLAPDSDRINSVFWNRLLLILLLGSFVAMVVMIIIFIRRRKQKEEDLLL